MELSAAPDTRGSQLSGFIAEAMGLNFPRERWDEMRRGLAAAAPELGFADAAACAEWLLSASPSREQLQVLASHLTIGETYFFRDRKTFDALAAGVLPELIRSRRGREQRLRLWSAGCCTGEEAYSLAILLHQMLPDLADWHVTILATDINARFLRKAAAGTYGEWSFRDAPAGFKERYFHDDADGRHVVRPEIRGLVTFAPLNLAEDVYPLLATGTNAMDLIFCRNVLMYFVPAQIRRVVGKLHHALADDGWLAVSPSETSQALFHAFAARNFPGAILYQKCGEIAAGPVEAPALPQPENPPADESGSSQHPGAPSLPGRDLDAEAADALRGLGAEPAPGRPASALLARALANQGRLAEALSWCDRCIAADKLDCASHYLRAVVLLEQGDAEQARGSLQRAVYLDPDFVLAHFALGNLARGGGRTGEADKHFGNALRLLALQRPDALLPESDGLTAGRLTEIIGAMAVLEPTR